MKQSCHRTLKHLLLTESHEHHGFEAFAFIVAEVLGAAEHDIAIDAVEAAISKIKRYADDEQENDR